MKNTFYYYKSKAAKVEPLKKKNKRKNILLGVILPLTLAGACVATALSVDNSNKLEENKVTIEALTGSNTDLETQLKEKESLLTTVNDRIKELEKANATLTDGNKTLEDEKKALAEEKETLLTLKATLEAQIAELNSQLEQAQSNYVWTDNGITEVYSYKQNSEILENVKLNDERKYETFINVDEFGKLNVYYVPIDVTSGNEITTYYKQYSLKDFVEIEYLNENTNWIINEESFNFNIITDENDIVVDGSTKITINNIMTESRDQLFNINKDITNEIDLHNYVSEAGTYLIRVSVTATITYNDYLGDVELIRYTQAQQIKITLEEATTE